ncbi:non-receptor serine/threonine protein kinase [Lithospermum erythrorhizon]|uniref:Non-receptor serine/threonine protein kinase n=1 Tax=Lithospermum erythrorhizon TaxID=34254 RepID=A0AAV3RC32_LITER
MCKRKVRGLSKSGLESECLAINHRNHQNNYQDCLLMDTTTSVTPSSQRSSSEDCPRVKFLCSFSGSILPRPQDGKLRYVGGETRIVSVPRDINYEELMVKMREIFEEAEVLKYQQPDEDLDALVSVVNDDDVTNMMEEYDKLGAGGGFTRLRIFLFSQSDQECSFTDGDERDHERWYVDALNNLNESPEFRRNQSSDFHGVDSMEDVHLAEQYLNRMSVDGGMHNQRNFEVPMAHLNLRHLRIPHLGSVQAQQNVDMRQNDLEVPWSPGYYSPRQTETHDPRFQREFAASPSSARFHTPYSEFSDQSFSRMPEEYNAHQVNHLYDHPIQYTDNIVLLPTGPVPSENGFPGNILHCSNIYEESSTCDNCGLGKRNQAFQSSPWNPEEQPHREASTGIGYRQTPNICAESPPYRDMPLMNSESNVNYPYLSRDQTHPRSMYNEIHGHNGGWVLQHQSPRTEELRHVYGAGRVTEPDHFVVDDRMVRQSNPSHVYGADHLSQVHPGHIPSQTIWRNIPSPIQGGLYDVPGSPQIANGSIGPGILHATADSPRLQHDMEIPQKNPGIVRALPEYSQGQPFMMPSSYQIQSDPNTPELNLTPSGSLTPGVLPISDNKLVPTTAETESGNKTNVTDGLGDEIVQSGVKEINQEASLEHLRICNGPVSKKTVDQTDGSLSQSFGASAQGQVVKLSTAADPEKSNTGCPLGEGDTPDDRLSFLPELMASIKKATLENVKEVTTKIQGGIESEIEHASDAESVQNERDEKEMNEDVEIDSDNENRIEPTEAEEEAIKSGLQTIRNEDLEEIRELGSGSYGSVFHGKWKGSDVAIKRIKARCFAGKPSERERLIADFWKEALMLSSLHHPNVVSFYGVVRDGPDGSLATVTEFMVNGSLKQFLRKKDRTIDRRKRLIIAMDTAFGMEYLHGKNIVHFDLKCENLLVNMRDPHRPVCKIGDLGLSKVKQNTLVSGGVRGTLPWMAPELLSGKTNRVSEKIDVYSFGIVMWELLTGDEPYSDMHCASVIGGIVNDSLRPEIPTWCDPEWKSLMESCWASDPSKRPSFGEISQKLRTMAAAMNLK